MKTIGAILSYNNPEMTDRLVENIRSVFKKDFTFIVVDNGSDKDKISKYSTHFIDVNCRMTRGFNKCIEIIDKEYSGYDNIWFFTNDCFFLDNGNCPLESIETYIGRFSEIGIIHPSLKNSVEVCYDIKNDPSINGAKCVVEFDIVCPVFTRNAIKSIGGKFNHDLFQGWGIDHESSFLVRKAGMVVCIDHRTIVDHNTSSTYDKGLDNLHPDRHSYYSHAMREMHQVLYNRYGIQWHLKFINNFNTTNGKILQWKE